MAYSALEIVVEEVYAIALHTPTFKELSGLIGWFCRG